MAYTPTATRLGSVVSGSEAGTAQIDSSEVNNAATFGVYNGGTGMVGGRFRLEAEI